MRRTHPPALGSLGVLLCLAALPALAQQRPLPPMHPIPPPPEQPAPSPPTDSTPPPASPATPPPAVKAAPPVVNVPATATIPAGTRIAATLNTPMSTRITKTGQKVEFRTSEEVPILDGVSLPANTVIMGSVVEARRPGSFGRQGTLKVRVDEIELADGSTVPLIARLDSQDVDKQGHMPSDRSRTTDLASLALWSAQGALLGAQIRGGKGAAVGAGAGAAIALLMMMSHRGPDIYLEPGTPFAIVLDQPLQLAGVSLVPRQSTSPAVDPSGSSDGTVPSDTDDSTSDPAHPKLKRRPKPPPG